MVRPTYSEVKQARTDVSASRAIGWPNPGGPYDRLLTAEMYARQITHIGSIPGVLMDMGFVTARQLRGGIANNVAAVRNRLHRARQTIAADRIATGELVSTVIMPTDVIMDTFKIAPDRAAPQLERLRQASYEGWDIRMTDPTHAARHLPLNSYSLIIVGDPLTPEAVYWEAADQESVPHETWRTDANTIAAAATTYAHIAASALDGFATENLLGNLQYHFSTITAQK